MELDEQGQALLRYLHGILSKIVPTDPRTYVGYKDVHSALGLRRVRERWGESLKQQGLANLAEWTAEKGYPGITGIVIDISKQRPGKGYFHLFGREDEDYPFLREQVLASMSFDWSPFLGRPTAPSRKQVSVMRVERDSALAFRVKELHQGMCQICGTTIELPGSVRYAEAHHIQPMGIPHNGPDKLGNIMCVCPNHHVALDYAAMPLLFAELRHADGHSIDLQFINYHNDRVTMKSLDTKGQD